MTHHKNSRRSLLSAILLLAVHRCFAAEMNVQLTTNDGSTKMSIQNSGAAEVASVDSQGNASFNRVTIGSSMTVTGNQIMINGVSYQSPSSQGGSQTVPQNDGSGNITWIPTPSGG